MCEPTTIMLVAGTAISAVSSIQAGNYQKAVANENARVGRLLAEDAIRRGDDAEKRHRERVSQFEGRQRAAMGGSGLLVDTGSFGSILDDTASLGELDALTIRANAEREAHSLRVGALNQQAQGDIAQHTGRMQAAGTLLQGAGAAYGAGVDAGLWGKSSTSTATAKTWGNHPGW